jgi:hypothetical protein
MTRRALGLALTMILGAAAVPRAQDPAPDQSLERMRKVLAHKPLQLDVPEAEPNFKIHIEAIHPMHEIFEKPPWQLPPILWRIPYMGPSTAFGSIPILNLDLLAIGRSMEAAKHERDVRAARGFVQRAIADYCAVQPNANTIQICTSAPYIR